MPRITSTQPINKLKALKRYRVVDDIENCLLAGDPATLYSVISMYLENNLNPIPVS
ncbi:hypothetical protein KDH_13590 [Dictyobacter sp. S3.2.2.5]|uniref:Uncharacterized protein n=1 Tax=Dictyobacter halimunensis TaxID=3026934 RepID=A0ABQ6FLH4_9CHLR|nr:hypothetical protein KDH_13590 [Dictyobacter sp. S3.2.2.5]